MIFSGAVLLGSARIISQARANRGVINGEQQHGSLH